MMSVSREEYYRILEELSKKYNIVIIVRRDIYEPGGHACYDKKTDSIYLCFISLPTFENFLESYKEFLKVLDLREVLENVIEHELAHVRLSNEIWKRCREVFIKYSILEPLIEDLYIQRFEWLEHRRYVDAYISGYLEDLNELKLAVYQSYKILVDYFRNFIDTLTNFLSSLRSGFITPNFIVNFSITARGFGCEFGRFFDRWTILYCKGHVYRGDIDFKKLILEEGMGLKPCSNDYHMFKELFELGCLNIQSEKPIDICDFARKVISIIEKYMSKLIKIIVPLHEIFKGPITLLYGYNIDINVVWKGVKEAELLGLIERVIKP